MPKTKAKQKLPIRVIVITVIATFIITLLLVWLANFIYLYQKYHAAIAADATDILQFYIEPGKLGFKSEADDDCLKPHWPWSKSYCTSSVEVAFAGSGDLKADKKLVLDKIKFSNFTPYYDFIDKGPYAEPRHGDTLASLYAAGTNIVGEPHHSSALFVFFTKEPADKDLAAQVQNAHPPYFIVFHIQSGFASGW